MSKTVSAPRARLTATRTRPSKRVPRWAVLAGAAVLAVIALGCGLLASAGGRPVPGPAVSAAAISPGSMTTVVTVNGQGVPVRELELFLAQDRAATFAYFQQKYNDNDRPGFWTTAYGGQTPQDYLRKAAIADATRATVTLQLGRTSGLLADPGYAAFLQSLNAENAQRRQALRENQPIYGPAQFTESGYFTYVQIQLGIGITKTLISHGVIHVTDSALEQYYRQHISDYQQGGGSSPDQAGPSPASAPQPFAQVKGEVTQDYETSSYNALITRLASSASVRVDAGVLAAIQIS
jgi:hypothetical protein